MHFQVQRPNRILQCLENSSDCKPSWDEVMLPTHTHKHIQSCRALHPKKKKNSPKISNLDFSRRNQIRARFCRSMYIPQHNDPRRKSKKGRENEPDLGRPRNSRKECRSKGNSDNKETFYRFGQYSSLLCSFLVPTLFSLNICHQLFVISVFFLVLS